MLPTKEISRLAQERFAPGADAAFGDLYAPDVRYWDTRSAGGVAGKAALQAHLGRLYGAFDIRYAILEEHRLEGRDGAIVLLECAVRRRKDDGTPAAELLMQRSMHLLELRDGLISREESYMDLAALDRLPAA